MNQTISLCIAAVVSSLGCSGSPTAPVAREGFHNVLFVGNSLTSTNDLPAVISAIAAAAGDSVHVGSVTGGNLALIDHLNGASDAVSVIAQGGWEIVVLQQGPTSTGGLCQDSMILWTGMFDTHIRAAGATTALYMVWPASDRVAFFDNTREAYRLAAAAVNGMFMPAGEAWRLAWQVNPALALYGGDGFHPSPMGTFLAALTIYQRITGRDPRTLPAQAFGAGGPIAMDPSLVRLLQEAAWNANNAFPAFPAAPRVTPAPRPASPSSRC